MEDFFKKLSIYGSIAKEEGQKIAQNALNKGREIADITKLKRDIKIEEDIIKSYKMVIGEYVAANDLLKDDELVFDQRSKILECQKKLDELNANIFSENEDIHDSFIFEENGINSLIYFEKKWPICRNVTKK